MTNSTLKIAINSLPKSMRDQVADFVEFLKKKAGKKTALKAREFGYAKGKIKLSDDFNKPLSEFEDYK